MKFRQAIRSVRCNSADFSGRASRSEYWYFILFFCGILLGCGFIATCFLFTADTMRYSCGGDCGGVTDPPVNTTESVLYSIGGIIAFAVFIFFCVNIVPALSASVRRLQDANIPGWVMMIFPIIIFAPHNIPYIRLIAVIAYFALMALPGTKGRNRYDDLAEKSAQMKAKITDDAPHIPWHTADDAKEKQKEKL